MKISVVIPVLNRWGQTEKCLKSLLESSYSNFSIIVVDHGSSDGTMEKLATHFPGVARISGSPDLWWAGATNLGIQTALERNADAIMLLNNDCYVNTNTMSILVEHLRSNSSAIIAPVQKDADTNELLIVTARDCYLLGFPVIIPNPSKYLPGSQNTLVSTRLIIGGRGVLIPSSVFLEHGLLDEENLPHYGSDNDFYIRCRRKNVPLFVATNTEVLVDPSHSTIATNPGQLTLSEFRRSLTDRRSHRNVRELSMLYKKHYPVNHLYLIGILLNIARYVSLYSLKRVYFLLSRTIKLLHS